MGSLPECMYVRAASSQQTVSGAVGDWALVGVGGRSGLQTTRVTHGLVEGELLAM